MSDTTANAGGSETQVMRPLSKGIRRDKPSGQIPSGGFYDLDGFISTQRGLKRRYGFSQFADGTLSARGPAAEDDELILVEGIEDSTTGSYTLIGIGRDWIYQIASSGFTETYRTYAAGTLTNSASATSFSGTSTAWASSFIKAGDILVTSGANSETQTIAGISSDTAGSVTSAFTYAHSAVSYTIYRKNGTGGIWTPTLIRNPNRLVLSSHGNELWKIAFDGTVSEFASAYPDATGAFSTNCVGFWRDRVYAACYKDGSDGILQQRYRWSQITDDDDFSFVYAFNKLDEEPSPIVRFVPLGDVCAIFFPNAIYLGEPSDIQYLPLEPHNLNTQGVGLVGQQAVCAYGSLGIFFQGQGNFYVITSDGLETFGDQVAVDALGECLVPARCQMIALPHEQQIWCGLTKSANVMEDILIYDIPSKSWSRFGKATYSISAPWYVDTPSWDDWTTETWDDESETTGPAWSSESTADSQAVTLLESSGDLWRYTKAGATKDPDGNAVEGIFETGDLDFDAPDDVKFVNRLALKVKEEDSSRTETISFSVELSVDEGVNWKSKGTLKVKPGRREGYLNFRAVGSTFRFRLTTSSEVKSYDIKEITLGVKGAGRELSTRWSGDSE
jgi:hypothetical protein